MHIAIQEFRKNNNISPSSLFHSPFSSLAANLHNFRTFKYLSNFRMSTLGEISFALYRNNRMFSFKMMYLVHIVIYNGTLLVGNNRST